MSYCCSVQRYVNFACVTFLQISQFTNPNIDLELDCIFGKPMKRRFQQYTVCTAMLSTFHAQVKYISVKSQWANGDKKPGNGPFPKNMDPHLVHQCLSPPYSPPQMTSLLVHVLPHNYATNSSLVTMGCPKFTTKTALPL